MPSNNNHTNVNNINNINNTNNIIFYIIIITTVIVLFKIIYQYLNLNINLQSLFKYKEYFRGSDQDNVNYSDLSDGGYTPWTISDSDRIMITSILQQILNMINQKIGTHYYFLEYDHLNIEKNISIVGNDGNIKLVNKYTADFFVHETAVQSTKRMISIFTLDINTGIVNVEHINLSNALRYPDSTFQQYYDNDLIIKNDSVQNPGTYIISGINDTELDYSQFIPLNKPGLNDGTAAADFNKWILPPNINKGLNSLYSMFPCREQTKSWDSNGINMPQTDNNLVCSGIKNTSQSIPLQPYINPTIVMQSTDKNASPNSGWLWDATENISGGNRMTGVP